MSNDDKLVNANFLLVLSLLETKEFVRSLYTISYIITMAGIKLSPANEIRERGKAWMRQLFGRVMNTSTMSETTISCWLLDGFRKGCHTSTVVYLGTVTRGYTVSEIGEKWFGIHGARHTFRSHGSGISDACVVESATPQGNCHVVRLGMSAHHYLSWSCVPFVTNMTGSYVSTSVRVLWRAFAWQFCACAAAPSLEGMEHCTQGKA